MAEMLVMIDGQSHEDAHIDAGLYKRGDVIVICRDGWPWSGREREESHWRIVKLPGVPEADLAILLAAEEDVPSTVPSRVLQRRGFHIDIYAPQLPGAVRGHLAPGARSAEAVTFMFPAAMFLAGVRKKARRSDPGVIGDPRTGPR